MQEKQCITIKQKQFGAGTPLVCVPLVGNTEAVLMEQAEAIQAASKKTRLDVVEFRGDFFEGLGDLERLKACMQRLRERLTDVIWLFTVRSEDEGGEALHHTCPSIIDINAYVIENKLADIVDVELFFGDTAVKQLVAIAKTNGVCVLVSNHDFRATPAEDEIISRLCKMQELGADIAKLAVMPQSKQDVLTLLSATERMQREFARVPIVTISMGEMGAISRISGEIFGSAMTFAALRHASAPGQIPLYEMNTLLQAIHNECV